jgi:putative endonuclease
MFHRLIYKRGDSKSKGQKAEDCAARFLERKGYKIIERNFRKRFGEIDIIVRKGNTLVFVEVRSLVGNFMEPVESISFSKKERILKAAKAYLLDKQWQGDVRFDFIGIKGEGEGQTIEHFEDFFGF